MAIGKRISTLHTLQAEVDHLVLDLYPQQGSWSEEQYLNLTDGTSRLVEFTDGSIEVLPTPTDYHQSVLGYLYRSFALYLRPIGGKVLFAPLRLRIRAGAFREPDLLLVRDAHDPRRQNRFWEGADLALEIVSPDKPERDLIEKRGDYAQAGIPEYWIVDPKPETITVLRLEDGAYVEHGVFGRGSKATSALLPDFSVSVDAVFDAG